MSASAQSIQVGDMVRVRRGFSIMPQAGKFQMREPLEYLAAVVEILASGAHLVVRAQGEFNLRLVVLPFEVSPAVNNQQTR